MEAFIRRGFGLSFLSSPPPSPYKYCSLTLSASQRRYQKPFVEKEKDKKKPCIWYVFSFFFSRSLSFSSLLLRFHCRNLKTEIIDLSVFFPFRFGNSKSDRSSLLIRSISRRDSIHFRPLFFFFSLCFYGFSSFAFFHSRVATSIVVWIWLCSSVSSFP